MHRRTLSAHVTALALAALLATLAPGCDAASRRKAEQSGSILALVGPPSPAEAAMMMADPFDADKRYKGVTWISNAPWGGADVYLRAYREMLANEKEDPGVRAVCARALAFHGSPDDAPAVAALLKSDDKRIRQLSARALQRLHNPAVIADLARATDPTKEVDKDTRQAAASALGQYADPASFAALTAALNDDDLSVTRTARQSLRTLTGQDFGDDPKAWQAWAAANPNPFAQQSRYLYPHFTRDKYLWEYVPFVPPPPVEPTSTPVGFRPPQG